MDLMIVVSALLQSVHLYGIRRAPSIFNSRYSRRALLPHPYTSSRDPSLNGYLSTLEHPGRHRHAVPGDSRKVQAISRGKIPDGADQPSPAGRLIHPLRRMVSGLDGSIGRPV